VENEKTIAEIGSSFPPWFAARALECAVICDNIGIIDMLTEIAERE
jgi:hypothetical protein